jgi:hypothetical protein
MDRKRLLELAGVPITEGTYIKKQLASFLTNLESLEKEFETIEHELEKQNHTASAASIGNILANLHSDKKSMSAAIADLGKQYDRPGKMTEMGQGESKMSTGMTGDEFDFEMEPDYITILRHNKDTGITIPMDNWDKMVKAYNRIITKGNK